MLTELVKFTDPKALCQLSCASKTLHIDLQGTKAWARLAERRRGWEVERLYADTVLREQDEIEAARVEQELEDEWNNDPEAECYMYEHQCDMIRELLDEAEASRAEAQLECERYRHWDPFFTLELEHEREEAARVARVEELREQDEIEFVRVEAHFERERRKRWDQAEYELNRELLELERERELAALLERVEARRELREQDEAEASRAEQEREEAEYERNNEAEASRAEAQLECERRRHWDPFFTLELEHEREEAARVARVEALREQDAAEASQAEGYF